MKLAIVAGLAFTTAVFALDNGPAKRLGEAASVFSQIMATPDKGIPQDLLDKAHCIVIVPSLKTAGFIVGGKYGKGYLSCRNHSGEGWSAPATVRIEGGSVGFQMGGSPTDRSPLARLAGHRQLKPTSKCTRRFFRGRGLRACLPVLLWKGPPCGKI